jgi:hypothetical protein
VTEITYEEALQAAYPECTEYSRQTVRAGSVCGLMPQALALQRKQRQNFRSQSGASEAFHPNA